MSSWRLTFLRKIASAVAALFVSVGFAGEPIQFSKDKPERDKEKDSTETQEAGRAGSFSAKIFRPYRPSETFSDAEGYKPKSVLPAVRPYTPPSNKREGELLDRQKNWIFLSPLDDKTNSSKDAFGLQDSNSLEAKKGILARFLESKSRQETNSANKFSGSNGIFQQATGAVKQTDSLSSANQMRTQDPQTTSSLQPQFLEKNFAGSEGEKSRMSDLWREQFRPGATRFFEEKQARMKEFESLFYSQNVPPTGGGNGSGSQMDLGSPLVTPGPGPNRFNPGAANSFSDPYKSVARTAPGSSILASPDVNSRVFGAPPKPTSSLEPVKSISQPAVLPFPKRHF